MAAKRFLDDSGSDPDQPNDKRIRTTPSFASVIGEVIMVKSLQNLCSALEPLLRRVVTEEIDRGLRQKFRCLTRSPSLLLEAPAPEPSSLQLMFSKTLSVPIFTGSKIVDQDNNPLQIILVDKRGDSCMIPTTPIKVEIVVLDGDFPSGDRENWTTQEFNSNIVKERTGKRPLLAGELNVTVRDGIASVGDIEFTDNSSWIRSRKFRIGVKVAHGSFLGVRIREGMTEPFVVKDHRGELYKKHHPPMLEDEVWRLEKIGKDGAFHKKLASEGINTVQDFLKLSIVDPAKLRAILGAGMSDKMWEVAIRHARECAMGNKCYILRGHNYSVMLNPVCQLLSAVINGQTYTGSRDMSPVTRSYIENLVRQAYAHWYSLEVVEGVYNDVPLLTQGDMPDQYPNHDYHRRPRPHQNNNSTDHHGSCIQAGGNSSEDWEMRSSSPYFNTNPVEVGTLRFTITQSSTDSELTHPRSFANGI